MRNLLVLVGLVALSRLTLRIVRATSLVCLLGLGLGLGSLLVYRLCRRIFGVPSRSVCSPEGSPTVDPAGCSTSQNEQTSQRQRSSSHVSSTSSTACSSSEHPSPDTLSDSGVSTMGNYQSDGASSALSPESSSTFPSVLYNSAGNIRFRGFRSGTRAGGGGGGADARLLEEERNPLVTSSTTSSHQSDDDDLLVTDYDDEDEEDEDDETQGLLGGRRCVGGRRALQLNKRSSARMRQQLTIDIPLEEGSSIHYQRGLATPGSDVDHDHEHGEVMQRDVSFDGQSIGGMSLMPNFSPTSLHEKNLRLDDGPETPGGSNTGAVSTASDVQSTEHSEHSMEPLSSDSGVAVAKSASNTSFSRTQSSILSSLPAGSATELTSCTHHPLGRTGDSPSSTNESDSSKICGEGSISSHTQSEYLSSEPRSRSLSPEVMTILSKYRNSFDSSGSLSPEIIKRTGRSPRHVKLSSSEPGKTDIDDFIERRRHCLKHSSSSVSSTTSSIDLSSRDLTLRARSLDFSDNPSGMGTPDSDLFNPGDVGLKTAASMEQIHKELVNIEQEIVDMSAKVSVLGSRENLNHSADALANVLRVLVRHKSKDESTMIRSLSACEELLEAEAAAELEQDSGTDNPKKWRYSYHHQGQYVWDYQSDLNSGATPPTHRHYVDHWGTLTESHESSKHNSRSQSRSRDHSRTQSPSLEHIISHLRHSTDSPSVDSDAGQQTSSLADLYIDDDDDLSGLVSGQTKLQVDGLQVVANAASAASNSDVTSLDSVDSVTSCHSGVHDAAEGRQAAPADGYSRLEPPEEEEHTHHTTAAPHLDSDSGPHGLCDSSRDATDGRYQAYYSNMQQKTDGKVSVGPRQPILIYATREWKGDTDKARKILKGYEEICCTHGLHDLRQIRGDNYCALRAVLFQVLRTRVPLIQKLGNRDTVLQKLSIFTGSEYRYLQEDWTFAGRLSHGNTTVVDTANHCISTLFSKLEEVNSSTGTDEEREAAVEAVFNVFPTQAGGNELMGGGDELLMEALKLLLLLSACELLTSRDAGKPVPTFAELLFARDTSSTLRDFVRNHLNPVGDSGGLEQIEMFLLGYTLGVQICVYRPSFQGQSDFSTTYGDDSAGAPVHTVNVVAEDDRHYNVIL